MIADACEQQFFVHMIIKVLHAMPKLNEKTLITLEEIRFFGSLNSLGLDTKAQFINELRYEWRRTWVKKSVQLEKKTDRVADFSSLNF